MFLKSSHVSPIKWLRFTLSVSKRAKISLSSATRSSLSAHWGSSTSKRTSSSNWKIKAGHRIVGMGITYLLLAVLVLWFLHTPASEIIFIIDYNCNFAKISIIVLVTWHWSYLSGGLWRASWPTGTLWILWTFVAVNFGSGMIGGFVFKNERLVENLEMLSCCCVIKAGCPLYGFDGTQLLRHEGAVNWDRTKVLLA